jgi:hypothetical protein
MTVEPDTPQGTDNDAPEQTDTAPEWDYYDPDEDQDTVEPQEAATDDGTEEAELTEEPEAEEGAPESVLEIDMGDGTKIAVDELRNGYLRQADYSRKTQELANRRQALEADVARLEGIQQQFIDHLTSLIPPAPDLALAARDPNGYVRQKAAFDAAIAKVQELVALGEQPKAIRSQMSEADQKERLAAEYQMLLQKFPQAGTEHGRQKFLASVREAAVELGFSEEDINSATDHRMYAMAYWAKRGMDADKAAKLAKSKVQAAPQMSPRKPGSGTEAGRNRDAMAKLSRSGSIRDALKVDWD